MARFYERGNVDEARGEYRIVVRTPDGKRVEIDLPRRVFEEIEELQREFWRTERREARHSLSLASMVIWQHFFGQGYERISPASLNPAGVM